MMVYLTWIRLRRWSFLQVVSSVCVLSALCTCLTSWSSFICQERWIFVLNFEADLYTFLLTDSGFVLHDWIHFQVKENLNSLSEHPACFPQKWLFVCFFSYYDTKAVFLALGITAVVCIAVTVFCFQTKVRCVWVCAHAVYLCCHTYIYKAVLFVGGLH